MTRLLVSPQGSKRDIVESSRDSSANPTPSPMERVTRPWMSPTTQPVPMTPASQGGPSTVVSKR
ncbi:hypothetical protein MFUL124B02_13080 [Myxococcus fulvus 124B02]|nr:hypothetical protein MFUL124B02_13080 [Myxococcus fulvus 124B02]